MAEVAKGAGIYDRNGQPFLNKTFTDEDLDLVSQAVLGVCDRLDNLEDGVIDNFTACTSAVVSPKLAAITCKGPKRITCLAGPQVAAIEKIFAGAKNSKGEMLYSDWAWDRGIGGRVGGGRAAVAKGRADCGPVSGSGGARVAMVSAEPGAGRFVGNGDYGSLAGHGGFDNLWPPSE